MSTGGSSEDQRRKRRRAADLEEGECSPGGYQSSSATEDYYNRDAAALSPGYESEETVSDDLGATAASSAAASRSRKDASSAEAPNRKGGATARSVLADLYGSGGAYSVPANRYGRASASSPAFVMIACRVCGKEFSSDKAVCVCAHMKVHALEALHGGTNNDQQRNGGKAKKVKKRSVEVAAGWGVTGRRGCSGLGTSMMDIAKDSPNAEPDHPVPAEPKLVYKPTPISFAMPENSPPASVASGRTSLSDESSSSKKPVRNDDIAEAAGVSPDRIPPADEPVVHQQQQPAPPPPGDQARARLAHQNRQNPAGYTCADPACRMWFSSHQALGGHVAAHKNSRRAAAAVAAGMHQDGAPKPEKRHPCMECPAVFDTGVQLGGHMRKHWKGDPIKPRKKQRPSLIPPRPQHVAAGAALHLSADVLPLALPIKPESQSLGMDAAQPAPAAAAEGTPEPAPEPRATGRVILFGIDIGLGVQTPPAQEGSPATKDSSASTDGEQQQ